MKIFEIKDTPSEAYFLKEQSANDAFARRGKNGEAFFVNDHTGIS